MRIAFGALLTLHGLIHLLGVARAFRLAQLPQLTREISAAFGLVWALAALLLLGAAGLLLARSRRWWALAIPAVVVSQALLLTAWTDAAWGTPVNLVILGAALLGFASEGPFGLRAAYRRAVEASGVAAGAALGSTASTGQRARGAPGAAGSGTASRGPALSGVSGARATSPSTFVSEEDLASLPGPLRNYLRFHGAVGRPRPRFFEVTTRGRIRSGPGDPWMPFTARQLQGVRPPSRHYLMRARRSGLPVDVLHEHVGGEARMEVRLFGAIPLVREAGPEMTRAENVTLFNELALYAPGALLDSPVEWEAVDDRSVRGRFTVGGATVTADLFFDPSGALVDFASEDRLVRAADGVGFTPCRWSTPVGSYRSFDGHRVFGRGAGRWHPAEGEPFDYIELEVTGLRLHPGD